MDKNGQELRERLKTYDYPNQKEELYDSICELLTSYEHKEEYPMMDEKDWTDNFYKMMVRIQNSWEMITAQE